MPVQLTSQLSLLETIAEGNKNKGQRMILSCFTNMPCSFLNDRQIAKLTGLDKNVVTARRNELVKAGKLAQKTKAYDTETNRLVIFWKRI